jgi:hypothetical protein
LTVFAFIAIPILFLLEKFNGWVGRCENMNEECKTIDKKISFISG